MNNIDIRILDHKKLETYLKSIDYFSSSKSKTYIINYYGPGEKKIDFTNCKSPVLQLEIPDVRYSKAMDSMKEEFKDKFKQVAIFAKEAIENGTLLICSCNQGLSRSAGTAKAIKQHYYGTGHEIDESGEYIPNPMFYEGVLSALEENEND